MAQQFFTTTNTLALGAWILLGPAGFLLHLLTRFALRREVAIDDPSGRARQSRHHA